MSGGFEIRKKILLGYVVIVGIDIICAVIIDYIIDADLMIPIFFASNFILSNFFCLWTCVAFCPLVLNGMIEKLGIPEEIFSIVDSFFKENFMFHDHLSSVESSP